MPAEVFVSYSRKDRERVVPWVQRLHGAGVSVWLDETGIDGALPWGPAIVEAIEQCRAVILMLSRFSIESEHVIREVTLAFEGRKALLPLLLEPTAIPKTLRYPLTGIQQIELFGGDREEKLQAVLRSLKRLAVSADAVQPAQPPRIVPHNLPHALTRFIGREREIAEVRELLTTARLVTLTGTGGCGKTRLALQVATDVLSEYRDGAWLVELAALAESDLVPQEVARALGIAEEPGRPLLQTLVESLKPRQLLLVLDNCEHLIHASAHLADTLVRTCRHVTLLATSREALGITGEVVRTVPSLTVPSTEVEVSTGEGGLAAAAESEAVRLFLDRVVVHQPRFALTNENVAAVSQVCRRLDGIPLAIELAAARVRVLSVEQIAGRLDDRFRLLTGGSRTVLPRQQTLRAALDWSYELLSEPERLLLQRLSVFAGGFSVEAVEAICAGDGVDEYDVLDLLARLADKSLVLTEEPGAVARLRLLETIRQYAQEKLQESGEADVLRGRHRDWHRELAEQAEAELKGPSQGTWLKRLARDHDDLRAALAWSAERGEAEAGLRLGTALYRFWWVRGHLTEGREWITRLLKLASAAPRTPTRANSLNLAGVLAWHQGDYGEARPLLEEGLEIRRELGDRRGIANSLINLGRVAEYQGDYAAARALYEESLAISRQLGDKHGIASVLACLGNAALDQGDGAAARALNEESLAIWRELGEQCHIASALTNLGQVALDQGEAVTARALLEESLALQRELGDTRGIATSLHSLGEVAHSQEDYAAARTLYEESLPIWRELGDRVGIANSLANLGSVALDQGDHGMARSFYAQSLALWQALGDRRGIAECLEGLAGVAGWKGEPARAAPLFAAAQALRDAIGVPLLSHERTRLERRVSAVRGELGEEAFAARWAEGQAISIEQAIASALPAAGHV